MRGFFVILFFVFFNACGIYSFSGASIPEGANTIRIPLLDNKAAIVVPSLAQIITEKLQDRCINETPLNLTNINEDILLSGKIVKYESRPQAAAGTDVAALNELVIAVEIEFLNANTGEKWTQLFTQSATFDSSANLTDVENDLIEEISTLMIDEIFNRAFVNW